MNFKQFWCSKWFCKNSIRENLVPSHTGPEWSLFVQKLFLLQKDINFKSIWLIIIKIVKKNRYFWFSGFWHFSWISGLYGNFSQNSFCTIFQYQTLNIWRHFLPGYPTIISWLFDDISDSVKALILMRNMKKSPSFKNNIKIMENENDILYMFSPHFSGKKSVWDQSLEP